MVNGLTLCVALVVHIGRRVLVQGLVWLMSPSLLLRSWVIGIAIVDYVDLVLYQNVALRGLVHLVKNC